MSGEQTIEITGKLIVGLTGNIATGKSAVMRLAAERDALTIDADKVVHEIMATDEEMQAALGVAFGEKVRREDGRIDRRTLGNIVFNDPIALQDLETMIHPAVRLSIAKKITESEQTVIFIEAIKLLEGGLAEVCHQTWVTRCSQQRQLDRLRICRGMDTGDAAARIKAQPPQEEKVAQADVVIDTNGTMRDTEAQFEMAWRLLPNPAEVPTARLAVPPPPQDRIPKRAATDGDETQTAVSDAPPPTASGVIAAPTDAPDGLEVRRAKPSDIPGLLLLIQRATDGAKKMKRAELLMALSERGYFIGQVGSEISTVMGSSIDSQVARVDEIYVYPQEMIGMTGTAVLREIERSAFNHMCQLILVFIPENASDELRQLFVDAGYGYEPKEALARNWQMALEESQPEGTEYLLKIMMDTRAGS